MPFRCLLSLFLIGCLISTTHSFADEESIRLQIQQYVQQLGDERFFVRERAESLLIQTGIQAYTELRRAKQSSDIEIARRAEYVLSRIEQSLLASENKDAAVWHQYYMLASHPAFKAKIIWFLADPTSDLNKGEGVQTLCRFVRFDDNAALRLEAAKSLIASPPFTPSLRQHWYRFIRDNVHEVNEDTLLQCLVQYAKLWCDLDDAEQKITPEFQNRVRQIGTETLQLLKRPENSIQIGSKIDLLLHYAVIEMYDTVGLSEDRDKVLAHVRAIVPEAIRATEPIESIMSIVDDNLLMSEHFYAGYCLKQRYRLHWAMPHYQKVMETGDISLRVRASDEAADIAIYLTDYSSAAAFLDKHSEFLESPEFQSKYNNASQRIAATKKRKTYCLAEQAAAANNWASVQQLLTSCWENSDAPEDTISDSEQVILAHRLYKHKDDVSLEFKNLVNEYQERVWKAIENDYHRSASDQRFAAMTVMCNSAAWFLANTKGDYQTALTFAEIALKAAPEDVGILDTLSHVYFLGGKVDDAIRIQERVIRIAPEATIFHQALERFKRAK
jgi:tetratricopeptide (TPR) repeat protein